MGTNIVGTSSRPGSEPGALGRSAKAVLRTDAYPGLLLSQPRSACRPRLHT